MSKKPYTLTNRPVCSTRGCKKGCNYKINKKTGSIYWRKTCSTCVNKQVAAKHGLKNIAEVVAKKAGFASVTAYLDHQARAKGFSGLTEYRNSTHSYRKHRKNYCENRDGRLGFKCTYRVNLPLIDGKKFLGHLSVDHINGNPKNNRKNNLQTLCNCCHAYKTILNGDGVTPGRKTLKARL
jgi:hypothetical protein